MAEVKKQKWEIKFEKYQNMGLMHKNPEEMQSALEETNVEYARRLAAIKDTTSEEYRTIVAERRGAQRETERLKTLIANMPKIERLKAFRDAQQEKLEKLLEQRKNAEKEIDEKKKLEEKAKMLEFDLMSLMSKKERLEKALKEKDIGEKDKEEIIKQLEENKQLRSKNQTDFSANQLALQKANSKKVVEVSDKQIDALKTSISKCNFACRLLVEGKRIEDVQLGLEQWQDRKLTRTKSEKVIEEKTAEEKPAQEKPAEEKLAEVKSAEVKPAEVKPAQVKPVEEKPAEVKQAEEKPNEEKPQTDPHPVEVSEFDKKHPRLAKIKNFFVKGWEKFQNWRNGEEPKPETKPVVEPEVEPETKPVENKEVEGKQTTEQMNARKAEFYRRLAETGRVSGEPASQEIKGWSTTPVVQTQEDNEPEQ